MVALASELVKKIPILVFIICPRISE